MSDGAIRNVSGAIRQEHWGDLYTNIVSRGSQIQAFRNGFNVVNSYWGPLTEDMSFVDHIEFVKGPAGFMLANGDPSGLYNVVTKKPTGQTKGEVTMTVGSWDLYRATLDLDGKLSKDDRLLYRLNVAAQNKKSFRANEFNNRYSIAPVVSYQLDDNTKLTLEYTWQHANMSDVGSFYVFSTDGYATLPRNFSSLPAGLPATNIDDHSIFLNLQHQINSNWKFTSQAAYFNYQQNGSSLWPSVVNPDGTWIRNVGSWQAKSKMTMFQAFINGDVTTGPVRHRILAGLDVANKQYWADWGQYHDLDTDSTLFDTHNPYLGTPSNGYPAFDYSTPLEERATAIGGLQDQHYTGLYVQDELGFMDNKLRLTLAGRYTNISQSAWGGDPESAKRFTPRIGLSYSVDKATAVYALYDQSFIPQGGKITGGAKVQPITGSNVEAGIKREWANGKWITTASIYRIIKNNELTTDPSQPATSGLSLELGQKISEGVEFDLRGRIANGLNLIANYAYTKSKITKVTDGVTAYKVGDVVPGFATHTMNAWLNYKVQSGAVKGLGASLGFTALLDRHTNDTWFDGMQKLPDYFKLDGGLFWEGNRVRITANVFNITDKYLYSGSYYSYIGAYYWQAEAPRNVRFSVAYSF
jgi:iron complex outermembrane recepter protein